MVRWETPQNVLWCRPSFWNNFGSLPIEIWIDMLYDFFLRTGELKKSATVQKTGAHTASTHGALSPQGFATVLQLITWIKQLMRQKNRRDKTLDDDDTGKRKISRNEEVEGFGFSTGSSVIIMVFEVEEHWPISKKVNPDWRQARDLFTTEAM